MLIHGIVCVIEVRDNSGVNILWQLEVLDCGVTCVDDLLKFLVLPLHFGYEHRHVAENVSVGNRTHQDTQANNEYLKSADWTDIISAEKQNRVVV